MNGMYARWIASVSTTMTGQRRLSYIESSAPRRLAPTVRLAMPTITPDSSLNTMIGTKIVAANMIHCASETPNNTGLTNAGGMARSNQVDLISRCSAGTSRSVSEESSQTGPASESVTRTNSTSTFLLSTDSGPIRSRSSGSPSSSAPVGQHGIFSSVDDAVAAATEAQKKLVRLSLDERDQIVKLVKAIAKENAQKWGKIELDETKIGRLDHKIEKLQILELVPGVEFLKTYADSGLNKKNTYTCRVRAFNAAGNSDYASTASAKPQ